MASTPGQYLLAVDRREVIETRIKRIEEKAAEAGTHPVFRRIFSKSEGQFENGSENVRRTLREQPTQDIDTPHVIVVCTHEGLLTSDLSTYDGWTLIIDENPNIWTFREVQSEHTWVLYDKFFGLEPLGDGKSRVTIRRGAPTVEACKRDTGISAAFCDTYRRWQASRPVVNLTSWDQAADGREWWWCSLWNTENLSVFKRVMILANSFEASVTYKLLKHAGVNLVPFTIQDNRVWQPRILRLRYFAEKHQAGTSFWTNESDPSGAEALEKAFEWIRTNSSPDNHYYSANKERLKRLQLPGEKLQPRVSGSDAYKHYTCASFIYTAKPCDAEVGAFSMYGISRDEVIRARQNEDLVQFLWRSWLRVPDDTRDGEFRVYDHDQARFLKEFIEGTRRPITVTLEHVAEAGVDDHKPRHVGRPRVQRTREEEKALADQRTQKNSAGRKRRRVADKQRRIEEGEIVRGPGRPTKDKSQSAVISHRAALNQEYIAPVALARDPICERRIHHDPLGKP